MKKMRVITGLAVLAIVVSFLVLYSCSKQDESMITPENTKQEKDYTIFNKISSFSEKMEFYKANPAYKSSESIDIDSALWLMEGAVNLTYGFPFEEYGEYATEQSFLTIPKNQDGQINPDELAIKYQELVEQARQDYYGSGFDEKGLFIVNLEKTEENESEVTFSVETVTGNKGVDPSPFNYGDNWWYGEIGGGCQGNNQTGSDAVHEMAAKYPQYTSDENKLLSDPKSFICIGGEEWLRRPNDPLDNLKDYYIFCVNDAVTPFNYDNDLCLLATEMSTYYWFLDYVITDLARTHFSVPYDHDFIKITDKSGYPIYVPETSSMNYVHEFHLYYAVPKDIPDNFVPIEL